MRLIIVALFTLGLSFAVVSQHKNLFGFLFPKQEAPSAELETLATVTMVDGQVQINNSQVNSQIWTRPTEESPLTDFGQLKTEAESRAKIRTSSGDVIEIEPYSHIQIENWRDGKTLLSVKSGKIFVQQLADNSKTMIYQNLQVFPIRSFTNESFTLIAKKATTKNDQKQSATAENSDSKSITKTDSIENIKAIQKVMGQQKFWLDKCYAGFLKKNPRGKGEIKVFFTLDDQGRVTEAKTHSSTFNDKIIESCVVQTVTRTRFADYKGETRQFIFPFQFNRQ